MTSVQLPSSAGEWTLGITDWAPASAELFQALATGRAVDDATRRAVSGALVLVADRASLQPLASGDGMFGWGGKPRAVWGANASVALPCAASLGAESFMPRRLAFQLQAQPGYPDLIGITSLGDVALRRPALSLKGRALSANGVARAGAQISVSGAWHHVQDYIDPLSASTIGALAAIAPGALRERSGATLRARVRQLQLRPERAVLLDDVLPGATRISVGPGIPFVPGSANDVFVLGGGPGSPEIGHATAVATPLTPDAVNVSLRHPLAQPHAAGSEVRRARLTGASTWSPLDHGVGVDDRTLCLATGAPLASAGEVIEIDGGTQPAEVQWLSRVEATTDARGGFTLPPLHRVAVLRLRAQHAAEPNPGDLTLRLEPVMATRRSDIVFPL